MNSTDDEEEQLRGLCRMMKLEPAELPELKDEYFATLCDGPWGSPALRGRRVRLLIDRWVANDKDRAEFQITNELKLHKSNLSHWKQGTFQGTNNSKISAFCEIVGSDLCWLTTGCQFDPRQLPIHNPFQYLFHNKDEDGWLVPDWLIPYAVACNNAKWIFARITQQEINLDLAHRHIEDPVQSVIRWFEHMKTQLPLLGDGGDEDTMLDLCALPYAWCFPRFYQIWTEVEGSESPDDIVDIKLTSREIRILIQTLLRQLGTSDADVLHTADWFNGQSTGTPTGDLFNKLIGSLPDHYKE